MRIIRNKRGIATDAELTKAEQLRLLKENNKRAKKFLQEQALREMTELAEDMGLYGKENTTIPSLS